jgi:predicted transcriptional regulator
MLLHSEIEANAVIPFLRTIVAKRLIEKYNLTQQQAAAKLGITQATISNYKNRSRENIELYLITKRIDSFADDIAMMIMKNSSEIEISEMFETTLQFIREQNIIYDLHKELEINHNLDNCPICKNNVK